MGVCMDEHEWQQNGMSLYWRNGELHVTPVWRCIAAEVDESHLCNEQYRTRHVVVAASGVKRVW